VEDDVSATPNRLHVLVPADGERSTSGRLPQVLLIVIVLERFRQAHDHRQGYHKVLFLIQKLYIPHKYTTLILISSQASICWGGGRIKNLGGGQNR
jgi:hypothetical protein